jgi:hypothetical protein
MHINFAFVQANSLLQWLVTFEFRLDDLAKFYMQIVASHIANWTP